MINYNSQYQAKITEFSNLYQLKLDENNRWIQLGSILPWDSLVSFLSKSYSFNSGSKGVNPRVIIGSLIVKHKLKLTDQETIEMIRENPYIQFFLGFTQFNPDPVFSPSLFVDVRKRLGKEVFEKFNELLIKITHPPKTNSITHKGELKIDATVADQEIRYPNDLSLINEARIKTEKIIDFLYELTRYEGSVKPRTYRRKANEIYLKEAKKKKKQKKEIRKALRYLLNCVKRNLEHIDNMLDSLKEVEFPLESKYQRQLWIIHTLWEQQWDMFINHSHTCKDRIVSLSQPHVRPIVRGKQGAMVEFGSKLGLSLFEGYFTADTLSWDAYNESSDLIIQAENYKKLLGYYPSLILADKIYWTNKNRKWCSEHQIRLTATPKGRKPKKTAYQKRKEKKEYARRNHVEGKIGNAKQAYNLNQIKAKLKNTSESWIGATLFVMNVVNFANIMNLTF
jgi:hypothetical protein